MQALRGAGRRALHGPVRGLSSWTSPRVPPPGPLLLDLPPWARREPLLLDLSFRPPSGPPPRTSSWASKRTLTSSAACAQAALTRASTRCVTKDMYADPDLTCCFSLFHTNLLDTELFQVPEHKKTSRPARLRTMVALLSTEEKSQT